jgi:hypothetical protein
MLRVKDTAFGKTWTVWRFVAAALNAVVDAFEGYRSCNAA